MVIPAINEADFESVNKQIGEVKSFNSDTAAGEASWVHIDVADGKFTKNKLWNNPGDLLNVPGRAGKSEISNVNIEVHLMVENVDDAIADWLESGVKRLIVHVESVKDAKKIKKQCENASVELFFASNPETSAGNLLAYKDLADGFLVLAVAPGISGQEFQDGQLEKITVLRQKMPDVKIEVDGGVNLKTASRIKAAGADILVSASYIWKSINPREAYEKLSSI